MALTILEGEVFDISAIFTTAGTVMTGFVEMAVNFVTALWANPIGKVVIVLPFVGAAIGLCFRLFLRKKNVK